MGARRPRFINVLEHVRKVRADISDPVKAIERRRLVVGGRIVESTRSLVRADASVLLRDLHRLRGERKLEAAIGRFGVDVRGRVCLDLGASAGGFTRVLLDRGARRVFAVDAGYGQLRGDLRLDPRVVNMERTNLADLRHALPAGVIIDLVTLDLSYLSLAEAVPQLELMTFASGAEMVALIKPMYELGLAGPPTDEPEHERAISHAVRGVKRGGLWRVVGTMASPVLGGRGAREWFLQARRRR